MSVHKRHGTFLCGIDTHAKKKNYDNKRMALSFYCPSMTAFPSPEQLSQNAFFAASITGFDAAFGSNTTSFNTTNDVLEGTLSTTARIASSLFAGNIVKYLYKDDYENPMRYVASFVARFIGISAAALLFQSDNNNF